MSRVPDPDKDGVRRYGHPTRHPEDLTRCAVQVGTSHGNWTAFYQCLRKRTLGEFCKQHAPIAPSSGVPAWSVSVRFNRGQILQLSVASITASTVLQLNGSRVPCVTKDYEWYTTEAAAQARAIVLADSDVHRAVLALKDAKAAREKMRKAWGK